MGGIPCIMHIFSYLYDLRGTLTERRSIFQCVFIYCTYLKLMTASNLPERNVKISCDEDRCTIQCYSLGSFLTTPFVSFESAAENETSLSMQIIPSSQPPG